MNNSIKARLAALQAIAAQKQNGGVAIMSLLPDGTWAACKGSGAATKVLDTDQAASAYLADCDTVIVIDL